MNDKAPCSRAGHSAIIYKDSMIIFGGKDEQNLKLNDIWSFNLNTYEWSEVLPYSKLVPQERSGHTACLYNEQYMMIFGGIFEVTKELDDLFIFDLKSCKWYTLFEEATHFPHRRNQGVPPALQMNGQNSYKYGASGPDSPFKNRSMSFRKKQSVIDRSVNLNLQRDIESQMNNQSNMNSPNNKSRGTSQMKAKRPVQSQANSRRKGGSSIRQSKDAHHGHHKEGANVHIELESPTSISMKNSFIIKNADPSFETYYKQMAKRKFNNNNPGSVNQSM